MNKRNLGYTTGGIIFFIVVLTIYLNGSKQLYGNDNESITKVINSIEGYGNGSIEILEIKDIDDLRIVAFLSNNNPGYIQFYKNKDGNYKWQHIEVRDNEPFSSFIPDLPAFMFVTNNDNEIVKMEVMINGVKLEQTFTPNKATVAWLNFPKTNKNEYTFRNYKYYDKEGNLVKED
ncbi:hypothetical protein [Litchfieldia salsa]|uniref:Uncharacterized protein n=1 Tax=Litchfieldia salsa TaxID=930152 RepID=A0A1H0X354_9BACI|nr:hypothetical protein [Litchfieldia salsa]SDP97342.1 hypothetical protein SAMN05216565_1287 [Litchfieldia salsa]